jgi:hypothetical protein
MISTSLKSYILDTIGLCIDNKLSSLLYRLWLYHRAKMPHALDVSCCISLVSLYISIYNLNVQNVFAIFNAYRAKCTMYYYFTYISLKFPLKKNLQKTVVLQVL